VNDFVSHLLDQARRTVTADAARPRSANLRRGISTAYYALFHHLSGSAGEMFAGAQDADWPLAAIVSRAATHADMKSASRAFLSSSPPALWQKVWAQLGIATNADLRIVAEAFVRLQQERHRADYDLSHSFTKQEALDLIQTAPEAIEAWDRLKRSQRQVCLVASTALLLWKQLAAR
jgi:uncharacterized protein (UPF0332 family)